ncbi:MAG: hypothetical protein ABIH49_03565 [archaeon]
MTRLSFCIPEEKTGAVYGEIELLSLRLVYDISLHDGHHYMEVQGDTGTRKGRNDITYLLCFLNGDERNVPGGNLESITDEVMEGYNPPRKRGRPSIPREEVRRIVFLYLVHRNRELVGRETGYEVSTISKYLHMLGFGDLRKERRFKQNGKASSK